ncbi:MAG: hypothetical protein AAFY38_01570 [Pseudomonadota bacterium]
MRKPFIIFGVLALAGCASVPEAQVSRDSTGAHQMRHAISPVALRAASGGERALAEQAELLTRMGARLERRATGRGAALGTAAGCALVVIDASRAKGCVAGAAIGAAVGAVQGKRAVQKRIEIVSGNELAKALRPMNAEMAAFRADLPAVLAAQDAELTALAAAGDARYDIRRAQIAEQRARLAAALEKTERQARRAAQHIAQAREAGQDGLGYHWMTSERLAEEAVSARAQIDLLS